MSTLHYYVSADAVNGQGTQEAPFSLAQAQSAVRLADRSHLESITVTLQKGHYFTEPLNFTSEDSGTENCPVIWEAEEERAAILDGALRLNYADFKPVCEENCPAADLERLKEDLRSKMVCCDLTKYGYTPEAVSQMYARGSFNPYYKENKPQVVSATLYSAEINCELFLNGSRMEVARYPDAGKLMGMGSLDKDRMAAWKSRENAWVYCKWDWYETAKPAEGFKENGGVCYVYNIPEELDVPGEYWISNQSGILYFLPPKELDASDLLTLSVTEKPVITAETSYVTFRGFQIEGSRDDGIVIRGDHNRITHCYILNVGNFAARLIGSHNRIDRCEITQTGRGGITLDGGDLPTLTAGENVAEGNYIHHWSILYPTYQPGVSLFGCGNICRYNRFYHSPHEAISYFGNNHLMEYNDIEDVCKGSCDAGAIYAGRRFDWLGNVINHNYLHNIDACGIYTDDSLAGQTICYNLMINIKGNGLFLGGGRDLMVKNNIVIKTGVPISYDDRLSAGIYRGGWAGPNGGDKIWANLEKSPWRSEIWQKAYPRMQKVHYNKEIGKDDPYFVGHPAFSEVEGNLIIRNTIGNLYEDALRFSKIENNAVHPESEMDEIFENPAEGNYRVKPTCDIFTMYPAFEQLPLCSEYGPAGLKD